MVISLRQTGIVDLHVVSDIGRGLKHLMANCYELFIPLILAIAYFGYSDIQHQKRMALIEQPQIHDFYFVDYHRLDPSSDAKFRYLPLKITSIEGDKVTFKVGNIAHTQQVSANRHVKSDVAMHRRYFRKEKIVLPLSRLSQLAGQNVIYDIARPENIFIEGWMVMHLSELSAAPNPR